MFSILDGLKYDTNETSCETETIWGTENRLAAAKGEGWQQDDRELGSSSSEPVYMERRSNMVLP